MREPHEGTAGRDRKPDGHKFTPSTHSFGISIDGLPLYFMAIYIHFTHTVSHAKHHVTSEQRKDQKFKPPELFSFSSTEIPRITENVSHGKK